MINLGAGSDTWYWNLVDEQRCPKRAWIEVDFSEITAKKVYQIRSRKQLLDKVQAPGWCAKQIVNNEIINEFCISIFELLVIKVNF